MNSILQYFNIKYYELLYCDTNSVIGKIRCLEDNQSWHTEIVKELLSILDEQVDCSLAYNEVCEFLDNICLL